MKTQLIAVAASLFLCVVIARGQAVNVTVRADQTNLMVGQTTVVRVFGEIVPALVLQSEQIFSFYIDFLNLSGQSVRADYTRLAMPNCDNTPRLFSTGTTDGPHRRGIFNTLMNQSGAGRFAPIELLNVPVTAVSVGSSTFAVQAGTTVPNLAHDFIVASTNVGTMFTGGNYGAAQLTLTVRPQPSLTITLEGNRARLDYPVWAGCNHYIQYQDSFDPTGPWLQLPGGPHNTGRVYDTLRSRRFYRLQVLFQ